MSDNLRVEITENPSRGGEIVATAGGSERVITYDQDPSIIRWVDRMPRLAVWKYFLRHKLTQMYDVATVAQGNLCYRSMDVRSLGLKRYTMSSAPIVLLRKSQMRPLDVVSAEVAFSWEKKSHCTTYIPRTKGFRFYGY